MRVSPELLVIGGQTVVAALITIALLWYARLFRETERRARQIAAINEIALTINASLDLQQTFQAITAGTRRLVPFDRACIALLNEAGTAINVIASTAEPTDGENPGLYDLLGQMQTETRLSLPVEGSAAGWAMSHGQAWVQENLAEEQNRPDAGVLWERHARWCVALPLSLRGEAIGVFSLSGRQHIDLDDETLETLRLIAEQVATATVNARLYAQTRALARNLEERVEARTRELREAQEQVIRSEKLALAGRLAAAIAHEVNNPLQSMRLYLELIAERRGDDPVDEEYLSVVQGQVDRIAGIVSRLLELYQPAEEAHMPVDLNALVRDLITFFDRRLQDAGITAELELEDTLPPVVGTRRGLRQVCLNLLLNAIEAMPDGGTLRVVSCQAGDEVQIRFTDTGVGIAPDVLSRVFDPFYTTKPNGAGLGLPVSYRVVQEHGGELSIDSRPGVGTTVKLILPVNPGEKPVMPNARKNCEKASPSRPGWLSGAA